MLQKYLLFILILLENNLIQNHSKKWQFSEFGKKVGSSVVKDTLKFIVLVTNFY